MYKDRIVRVRWKKGRVLATSYGRLMTEFGDCTGPKVVLLSQSDYMSSMKEPSILSVDAGSVKKIDQLSVQQQV
jgi:hypothetical protein